ncbi:hypothetical protein SNE25_04100 [Mucilaginibacter sabulilitoris]|uniref:Uncharacterized protein n=1 Tax=Mucilaginibacter sabulilitoris TaxID=1173583 RepID=A0ABZ0TPI0_9SPHI|nr:hypothetical protein [Mucilaginibacter sabulilitoris]WPU94701.1 hypothetical protein SNE25_04100 [Mucilaginibacter sabulilitoris]
MTRSNLYIKLSNGKKINAVADSSSAPEQGYIVEHFLFPLLRLSDTQKELDLLQETCTLNELRSNATYCYTINLRKKIVRFYEENYDYRTDTFRKGKNLTKRYIKYLQKESDLEKAVKAQFAHLSNRQLVKRINSLPDFKWNDEGTELYRRMRVSIGRFDYAMRGNTMVIIYDLDNPQPKSH